MIRKMRGFTLIELLITLSILGILLAIAIPSLINAQAKAKSKACMSEIHSISVSMNDYVVENGSWAGITQSGELILNCPLITELTKLSASAVPVNDPWGNPYRIYCDPTAVAVVLTGLTDPALPGSYVVSSLGADGAPGPISAAAWSPTTPDAGFYRLSTTTDLLNDLVLYNGNFIVSPKAGAPFGGGL